MIPFFRKLSWWMRRRSREAGLREELEFHLEEEAEERQAEGLTVDEAHRAARRDLGNVTLIQENTRALWTWTFLQQLAQDLHYAFRAMGANKAFTAVAVVSLALGIGANTAIYSFLEAILMRDLPVQDPESLVMINWHSREWPYMNGFSGFNHEDPKLGYVGGSFPFPAYELLRSRNTVFSSIFAFASTGRLTLQIHGQADLATGQYVTGRFFSGLGVRAAAGRLIGDSDDSPASPAVAVLGFAYARKHFGDAASATGQRIVINTTPFTVIGVAAPEFFGVDPAETEDFYVPMLTGAELMASDKGPNWSQFTDSGFYWVQMMGRLRAGVTPAQAQAALAPPFRQWAATTASTAKQRANLPALVMSEGGAGIEKQRFQFSEPLMVLMAMVGLILAIACVNLASLLMARATARRREIALRLSLGAGRFRVVRQLLTESVLLSSLGGLFGVLFAGWGIQALTWLLANGDENFTLRTELNWHVLGAAAALSLIAGIVFGLAPALHATRVDLNSALKQPATGEPRMRFRHGFLRVGLIRALVVSQIAISVLLLVAAGLFVRTLSNLHSIPLGFNSGNVLLFTVDARQAGYDGDHAARFYQDLHARLSPVPGVNKVTESSFALLSGRGFSAPLYIAGKPIPGPQGLMVGSFVSVGPSFLATMQIPILLGRDISPRDIAEGAKVAVVNERFVKEYLNGGNPLGRHFGLAGDREIVGVAKNARYNLLKRESPVLAYVPYSTRDVEAMTYELRTGGNPLALAGAVRRVVHEADARIPVSGLTTQARLIDRFTAQERTFATLSSCFAILALVIACVGLYGTLAYTVARRTGEIGLRMALGAQRRRLLWMVLHQVIAISVSGLAIGLPVALAVSRSVESLLFGIKPNDPLAVSMAAAILLAAALLAGFGPAWRASRIDPWDALRHE